MGLIIRNKFCITLQGAPKFKLAIQLIGVGRFRKFWGGGGGGGGARFIILGGPRGAKFPVGT